MIVFSLEKKLTQMISLVQALKFYGAVALASVKVQSLDMPVAVRC